MALFHWQEGFCINVPEIDGHHIHLVELLNSAYDDFRAYAPPEQLQQLFLELIDYANYHFTAEERIMAKAGFPGTREHASQHREFAARLAEMHREYQSGKPVYLKTLTFLQRWLESHILESDKKLGLFLNTAQQ